MFFKIIKFFFIRKKVKELLINYKLINNKDKIKTIGLFVDETFFEFTTDLVNQIVKENKNFKITVLKFSSKKNSKIENLEKTLKLNKISLFGKINHQQTIEFINTEFDLLISFYDLHKPMFKLISIQNKSKFKVGINSVNKNINNLVIQAKTESYKEIVSEMFKYLKILNKI